MSLPKNQFMRRRLRFEAVEKTLRGIGKERKAVKVYAKLPAGSKSNALGNVTTQIGPCWLRKVARERLYFVVETKSSLFTDGSSGQGKRQRLNVAKRTSRHWTTAKTLQNVRPGPEHRRPDG